MTDKKISALTGASTPLAGTEVLPIVQSGSTVKVSVANLTAGRSVSASSIDVNSTGAAVSANVNNTDTTGMTTIVFGDGTNTKGQIWVGNASYPSFGGAGSINYSANSGPHVWYKNYTEIGRWDTSGNFNISNGNLIQGTAAKGVNFTANTPAAGMTSQLLNWYEEGTWTPSVASSSGTITAYTVNSAKYTRIGRQVTATVDITITTVGTASGALTLSPPFTCGTPAGGAGRETATTGFMLMVLIGASADISVWDGRSANGNFFVGGDGTRGVLTVTYFV